MAEKKKNAPRVTQPSTGDYLRTLGDMLVVNPRNSPAATLGGAAYDYVTRSTPQSVVRDIRSGVQGAEDWLRKQNKALRANPVTGALQLLKAGYIDPLADPFRVFQQAATERSRGNEAGGAKLAAMVPLAVAGVVNPQLRGTGRVAANVGVDVATKTAKKAATPSVKVTPKAKPPSLLSAVRVGGKTYTGPTHLDALDAIPDPKVRSQASLDANSRGFVNERGKYMDRFKAADYARNFDLFSPDAPDWAKTAPEVISENLRLPEIAVTPKAKTPPAAPAYIKTGSGANRDLAADVFAATSSKQKGAPSFSDWRKANEGALGTMFDYGSLRNVPDVPQFQIERSVPAQGPSARIVDALDNPDVARGINETVERGADLGGLEWYNTDPLYRRLVSSVGEADAPAEYSRLMDVVAATSPRAKVQDNIRMASYYNYLLKNGIPIPDKPAAGYGSVAQTSHVKHARNIGNEGGWNIFENPKPASFSSNLQGNQQVATIDTHNFRLPGIISQDPRFLATSFDELVKPELNDRTKIMDDLVAQYPNMQDADVERFVSRLDGPKPKVSFRPQDWLKSGSISMDEAVDRPNFWASQPNDNEYGYYEKWQQEQAKKLGMSPAQYQASMWVGGGEDTGLGSVAEPFLKTFEARIKYTADRLGVSPDVVMEKMLKGEMPLMAQGGSVDAQELAEKYGV
jgi:hypothetical protein